MLKTKEQIKQEIKTLLLNDNVVRDLIQDYKDVLEPNIDELATERANTFKTLADKFKKEKPADYKNDSMTEEFLKSSTSITFWKELYTSKLNICNYVLKEFSAGKKIAEYEYYIKGVDFITSKTAPDYYAESEELEIAKETASDIVKYTDGAINFSDELLEIFLTRYVSDIKGSDTAKQILQTSKDILARGKEEKEIHQDAGVKLTLDVKGLADISDDLKPYLYAIKDIKNNVYILIDEQDRLTQAQAEEIENGKELNLKNGVFVAEEKEEEHGIIAPRILNYPDIFTIADTEILNVLTTAKYNIDLSVFEKSNETLKQLSHQDREILDYIVLTLYNNEQTIFSDYQIATGLYKEQTGETVSDAMLKDINDSIDRIRNVRIDEGFISAEKIGDLKAEVKINDHLITLRRIDVKHENKTTWYRIIGDPFYYDYAVKTNKINHYKKQIITRNSEDLRIENNIKNETLKMMLARRVISLKYYKQTIINMAEIYDVLGIKDARKYTDARNKTKAMLEDLQKEYNFKYSFKKKGRTTTRLILERYTDRPLEIEKKFS